SSRRRHTRWPRDWSSDVCSSDLAALVWAFTGKEHGLNNVISVIIFSCPCAFILATPTAMVAALSAAARLGILIKNVADIEMAARSEERRVGKEGRGWWRGGM